MKYNDKEADIAIIGAGVVGCAIARILGFLHGNKKIVVIEKRSMPGLETSLLNSNVIHSGLHEPAGSFKGKFAREGSKLIIDYMLQRSLPIYKSGMIIAIPRNHLFTGLSDKLSSFIHLMRRGKEQMIDLKILTYWGIKRYEPNIEAIGGIFIPNVWIISVGDLVYSLYSDAISKGVEFYFNSGVTGLEVRSNKYQIITSGLKINTRTVINAAGLYADQIAAMAGFSYQLEFWRGEYYEVIGGKNKLVKRLIYPVVPAVFPSKGIHFSPRVNGRLFIGPNARLVPLRNYYNEDITPREVFHDAVYPFCPKIKPEDLRWAYSGIRPKIKNWESDSDFKIKLDCSDPPFLNLIGIESPGLTSSMAIAAYVEKLLKPWL
ncbi:MAG: NAD(P)/FAD-dependent oxidoreductase [Candidatus Taylorbacteria bacterium]|nr:NAD(P)/FAD-dependent oxidoreductase [Candidatus Taylorbacteria bacterium]